MTNFKHQHQSRKSKKRGASKRKGRPHKSPNDLSSVKQYSKEQNTSVNHILIHTSNKVETMSTIDINLNTNTNNHDNLHVSITKQCTLCGHTMDSEQQNCDSCSLNNQDVFEADYWQDNVDFDPSKFNF